MRYISQSLIADENIGSLTKLLGGEIARCGKGGVLCAADDERLAARLHMSRSTLRYHHDGLVRTGWILNEQNGGGRRRDIHVQRREENKRVYMFPPELLRWVLLQEDPLAAAGAALLWMVLRSTAKGATTTPPKKLWRWTWAAKLATIQNRLRRLEAEGFVRTEPWAVGQGHQHNHYHLQRHPIFIMARLRPASQLVKDLCPSLPKICGLIPTTNTPTVSIGCGYVKKPSISERARAQTTDGLPHPHIPNTSTRQPKPIPGQPPARRPAITDDEREKLETVIAQFGMYAGSGTPCRLTPNLLAQFLRLATCYRASVYRLVSILERAHRKITGRPDCQPESEFWFSTVVRNGLKERSDRNSTAPPRPEAAQGPACPYCGTVRLGKLGLCSGCGRSREVAAAAQRRGTPNIRCVQVSPPSPTGLAQEPTPPGSPAPQVSQNGEHAVASTESPHGMPDLAAFQSLSEPQRVCLNAQYRARAAALSGVQKPTEMATSEALHAPPCRPATHIAQLPDREGHLRSAADVRQA